MRHNAYSQSERRERKKIIIWGAGGKTKEFLSYRCFYDDVVEIAAITDSDNEKWGTTLEGCKIISPQEAYGMNCERFIVPSGQYFDEIADRIVSDTKIRRSNIESVDYITKCKLKARYRTHSDKADILSYIENNPLGVFNYPFVKKYEDFHPEVGYDEDAKLFYVIHKGYKMYMARQFNTLKHVSDYYKSLCIEQDENSPHLYLQGDFDVKPGDVVVDVGAAEGIFALEVIERAKKIYLIETSGEWIEALEYTFKDYKGKIEIINKFVSDYTAYGTTTLDDLFHGDVDFIKMDIEGYECAALAGASELIRRMPHIRCVMCTYHNDNDETALKALSEKLGMKADFSEGYMFFMYDVNSVSQKYIMPTLRRGVIRCEK